jgi:hypothetical protein
MVSEGSAQEPDTQPRQVWTITRGGSRPMAGIVQQWQASSALSNKD